MAFFIHLFLYLSIFISVIICNSKETYIILSKSSVYCNKTNEIRDLTITKQISFVFNGSQSAVANLGNATSLLYVCEVVIKPLGKPIYISYNEGDVKFWKLRYKLSVKIDCDSLLQIRLLPGDSYYESIAGGMRKLSNNNTISYNYTCTKINSFIADTDHRKLNFFWTKLNQYKYDSSGDSSISVFINIQMTTYMSFPDNFTISEKKRICQMQNGFWCRSMGVCINAQQRCDGADSCFDGGTDEENCYEFLNATYYQLNHLRPITDLWPAYLPWIIIAAVFCVSCVGIMMVCNQRRHDLNHVSDNNAYCKEEHAKSGVGRGINDEVISDYEYQTDDVSDGCHDNHYNRDMDFDDIVVGEDFDSFGDICLSSPLPHQQLHQLQQQQPRVHYDEDIDGHEVGIGIDIGGGCNDDDDDDKRVIMSNKHDDDGSGISMTSMPRSSLLSSSSSDSSINIAMTTYHQPNNRYGGSRRQQSVAKKHNLTLVSTDCSGSEGFCINYGGKIHKLTGEVISTPSGDGHCRLDNYHNNNSNKNNVNSVVKISPSPSSLSSSGCSGIWNQTVIGCESPVTKGISLAKELQHKFLKDSDADGGSGTKSTSQRLTLDKLTHKLGRHHKLPLSLSREGHSPFRNALNKRNDPSRIVCSNNTIITLADSRCSSTNNSPTTAHNFHTDPALSPMVNDGRSSSVLSTVTYCDNDDEDEFLVDDTKHFSCQVNRKFLEPAHQQQHTGSLVTDGGSNVVLMKNIQNSSSLNYSYSPNNEIASTSRFTSNEHNKSTFC